VQRRNEDRRSVVQAKATETCKPAKAVILVTNGG
jgi:hypothetical protein